MQEKEQNITKTWITSDLHFFHDNIVEHCQRPTTPEEHNEWLINILNSYIGPNDTVYHSGDFAFGKNATFDGLKYILSRLNGTWLFILGNHDKENQLREVCKVSKRNHKVLGYYYERRYKGKNFCMFHYPIENWNKKHYGSIHLHGHIHKGKNKLDLENRYNVCFDVDLKPHLLDDFIK